ncbi:GIY-YIG nuclease family protein [Micromonospora zamorensis]|uniref:GIY-YIG nuclease family protein n=1 Tax=Micromonospora zamorensis TaxID=709883 RepID=UPI0033EDBF3C
MTEPQTSFARVPAKGTLTEAQYLHRVENGYYIYGLVDPQALRETGDRLLSIFYVGKGTGARWSHHEENIADQDPDHPLAERYGYKDERIRKIRNRGEEVRAVLLSGGYIDERDAYYAEALAIDTISAALAAAGRPPLTNSAAPQKAGFIWLSEHLDYTQTDHLDLDTERQHVESDLTRTEILVKGDATDIEMPHHTEVGPESLPDAVAMFAGRITVLELFESGGEVEIRRGWDPLDPWDEHEAQARAQRYWPLDPQRVARWLDEPDSSPEALLLGIPRPGGLTVVRYAWEIDRKGDWEYYPQTRRWGIPLGKRLLRHPRLGRALFEQRDGKHVQVLANYASGIRQINAPLVIGRSRHVAL